MSSEPYTQEQLAAGDPDGRLYNEDLKPATPQERVWGTYSLFSLWMNDAHNAGNYTFAAGLFLLGMSAIEVTLGILGGALIIFAGCCMSGFMGHDTGTPYPVVSRMTWGVWGANLPAIIRGIVAIAWYGIQTFLASLALKVLILHFVPGLMSLTETSILGMDVVGWIAFLILWAIQMVIVAKGMEAVRHFQGLAGPAIWVVMIVLAVWMLWEANWSISLTTGSPVNQDGEPNNLTAGDHVYLTFATMGWTVGILATLMLNFSDFARYSPSRKDVTRGNAWGLPLNWTAFALTSVLVSAASIEVWGSAISDPAHILERIDNDIVMIFGSFIFVMATIGVNIVANFVSAAYDVANINPKRISFRTGGIITSILALVSLPWNLFNSPEVITYFLGGLGALLGPFFGILALDYFWYRKGKFSIPDMYKPTPESRYWYANGWNTQALYAFAPAAAVSLLFSLVPVFSKIAPFGWFIGAALGALFYYLVTKGKPLVATADSPLPEKVPAS